MKHAYISVVVASLGLLVALWGFSSPSNAQILGETGVAKRDLSRSKNIEDVAEEMRLDKERRDLETALARATWHETIQQPATIKVMCDDEGDRNAKLHLGPVGRVVSEMRNTGFFHAGWEAEARERLKSALDGNYHLARWCVKVTEVTETDDGNKEVKIWVYPIYRHTDFDIGEVHFNGVWETWAISRDGSATRTKVIAPAGISQTSSGTKAVPLNLNVQ